MKILLALTLYTSFAVVISFKDWFKGLCLLLIALAFMERPEMPRSLLGISGLNIYNIILLAILSSLFLQAKKEQLSWQVPKPVTNMILIYMVIFFVAFVRMELSYSEHLSFYHSRAQQVPTQASFVIDYLINPLRWFLPFLLFCYGINSDERRRWAIWSVLATISLLALQIISRMMPALIGGDDLAERALRVLDRNIGYHRVDLAALMAGSAWAVFCSRLAFNNKLIQLGLLGLFGLVTLALLLTGGRTGYAAWAAVGSVLLMFRWKKWLMLAPVAMIAVVGAVPGLLDRMTEGFTEDSHSGYAQQGKGDIAAVDDSGRDMYAITSGRITVWPSVLRKISDSPLTGYGLHGFRRLDMNRVIEEEFGFVHPVGHPHNAYLQYALDNGIPALILVLTLFVTLSIKALRIFVDRDAPLLHQSIAGIALSYAGAHAVACMGSQSFYPTQGSVLMWCSFGILVSLLTQDLRKEKNSGEVRSAASKWEAYRKPELKPKVAPRVV